MTAVADLPTGAQHELRQGRQRLVATERGATWRSWTVDGRELLDSRPDDPDEDFRGHVLMPWPNRLRDGRYLFEGTEHRTPLTEPERGNAIHGLANGRRWRALRSSTRHLTLVHELEPQPGYPFALRLAVQYELTSGGVVVTLRATNVGPARAPFGAGLHPYLTLGAPRIDDDVLELRARTVLPVDDRMLPTGPGIPVEDTELDLRRPRRIGTLRLDTCFGELQRNAAGVARVRLTAPDGDRQLTLWVDRGFRYLQVYTADSVRDPARRRSGVAIEPMTCAPDAFNSGDGLVVLDPGVTFTARCGLAAAGF
jgi:aldose 1-epimerase